LQVNLDIKRILEMLDLGEIIENGNRVGMKGLR
jgi:hypothetical protein